MTCAIPDCKETRLYRRGFCQPCYKWGLRTGTIERKRKRFTDFQCFVLGCAVTKHNSNGLCAKHFAQWRRAGKPDRDTFVFDAHTDEPTQAQRMCEFHDCANPAYAKNFCRSHYGMLSNGRELRSLIDKDCPVPKCSGFIGYRSGLCPTHYYYMLEYTLTLDEVIAWFDPETRKCHNTACGSTRNLHLDHDHRCTHHAPGRSSCGQCVRGWLCSKCNKALGLANDDKHILRGLIDYLSK